MAKLVPVGARHELHGTVHFEHTLTRHHPELPPVYSTPEMIRLMETACFFALQPYAEGDEITVGTHIDVAHTAAVGVGAKVNAEAVLESFDGRFYTLRVRAWTETAEGEQEIGHGKIGRAFVSAGKFLGKVNQQGA